MRRADPRALETRASERAQSTRKLPWIGREDPYRTPGKEKQASSVPACGGPTRPKKPVRRCFKLRPPWRAGFAGFASGCRLLSGSGVATWMPAVGIHPCDHRSFKTPGGCPAVDRMPTNRHAATGTCEIGHGAYTETGPARQGETAPERPLFRPQSTPRALRCKNDASTTRPDRVDGAVRASQAGRKRASDRTGQSTQASERWPGRPDSPRRRGRERLPVSARS